MFVPKKAIITGRCAEKIIATQPFVLLLQPNSLGLDAHGDLDLVTGNKGLL